MRSRKLLLKLSLVLLATVACRNDGTGPGGPSWFRASLSGEVTTEYEGNGDFASLRDDFDSPYYFMLFSEGTKLDREEKFYFRWPSSAQPGVGSYDLVPHADRYGSPAGVTAVYTWQRGDNVSAPSQSELYVGTGGVVEITRSTPDEVEGTVRFSGIQVGKWGTIYPERMDPRHQPDPTAPRIDVTGTFRATKFDINDWTVTTGG